MNRGIYGSSCAFDNSVRAHSFSLGYVSPKRATATVNQHTAQPLKFSNNLAKRQISYLVVRLQNFSAKIHFPNRPLRFGYPAAPPSALQFMAMQWKMTTMNRQDKKQKDTKSYWNIYFPTANAVLLHYIIIKMTFSVQCSAQFTVLDGILSLSHTHTQHTTKWNIRSNLENALRRDSMGIGRTSHYYAHR